MLRGALFRGLQDVEDIDTDLKRRSTRRLTGKVGAGAPGAASARKMLKSQFDAITQVVSSPVAWSAVVRKIAEELSENAWHWRQWK